MSYKHNRLQQLRGFCCAARMQSISKAAQQLQLSQPSVSLQIQALEQDLGVQLFERRGPRIRLTPDGEQLVEMARPLVEGFDSLEAEFAAKRDGMDGGTIRVAAGGSTLQYILPPFVNRFIHDYPQIDLQLHNVTGKTGLARLRSGEVDLAIGPMPDIPQDIEFRPFVVCDPILITSLDHPLARRKRIDLRAIAKYPMILPPREQSTYGVVEKVFAENSLQTDVRLEVGGYDIIKTYVALGLGISIVMSHCLTGDEKLHTARMRRWLPQRSYGLVLRRGQAIPPHLRQFIHTLCPGATPSEARN